MKLTPDNVDNLSPENAQFVKDQYREAAEQGWKCTVNLHKNGDLTVRTGPPSVAQQMAAAKKKYQHLKRKTPVHR